MTDFLDRGDLILLTKINVRNFSLTIVNGLGCFVVGEFLQPKTSFDKVSTECLSYKQDDLAAYSTFVRPVFNVSNSVSVDFETSLGRSLENEHSELGHLYSNLTQSSNRRSKRA